MYVSFGNGINGRETLLIPKLKGGVG